jgi:hypothetical protein
MRQLATKGWRIFDIPAIPSFRYFSRRLLNLILLNKTRGLCIMCR